VPLEPAGGAAGGGLGGPLGDTDVINRVVEVLVVADLAAA
jgi:hypothetical protein